MPDTAAPPPESHSPATFKSRGVAVPFTTPLLAGARLRQPDRAAIELVVPNLSGATGTYVLRWPGVRAVCNPTLHDTMLFRRFSGLAAIDPAGVRAAALATALEGYAGQQAAAAAAITIERDRSHRVTAQILLSTRLAEQSEPRTSPLASGPKRLPELERRVTAAWYRLAPAVGAPATRLAAGLAAIGDLFAPAGVAADDRDARIPRLLIRLAETCLDLSRWLDTDPGNDVDFLGRTLVMAIQAACDRGAAVLATTRSMLTDPTALLTRWISDEAGVTAAATRCDWLLDGWDRVAQLWLSAGPTVSRRGVLLEMAPLIPMLPHEVLHWSDLAIPAEAMAQACRITSHQDAWRTGAAALGLIERNETLLAMSI